ncbi:MAG TPA: MG2 domain-containing protein, partial [Kofleriaceae bacterium]|nr:MG2 domain-containing protein [Kofleriaceae bacterium]
GNNTLVETSVDLAPALAHGLGHVIAFVEPYPWNEKSPPPRMIAWIQSTKIGIDAHADNDQLIAFATDLVTGKPAASIAVEMRPFGITGTTDAAGIAKLDLASHPDTRSHYLLARRGDDTAFVADPNSYYGGGGGWWHQPRGQNVAWYVTDDRQMYKPGEEVNLKGWLRTIDTAKNGDVGAISGITSVTYTVHDSQGAQIATGTATVNAIGGFDTKFTLPKTPNLGYANVSFQTKGGVVATYAHGFQIQEFRRPEFEVSAQASQGPFIVGGSGDVTVSAKYYSGGPLPGAPVAWNVTASQTSFTPPNRDEFIFGQWVPWWGYRESFDYDERGMYGRKPPKSWNLVAKTDATGAHVMHLDFLGVKPAMPMSVMTNVSVTDVNRQSWSAGAALIVHPSSLYVGVRTKKPFVDKGQPFPIDLIGVDLDGKAVPGAKITVHAVRLDWEYKHGKYETKEVDPQDCAAVAAKDPVPCEFKTTHGGTYQLTATITDAQGRPNTTKLQFWVTGGDRIPARDVQQ